MYRQNDESDVLLKIAFAVALLVLVFVMETCSVGESRSKRNMALIKDGYCYDINTKVIYIESKVDKGMRTIYTNYYDENGRMCRYLNGKWVPIKSEKE